MVNLPPRKAANINVSPVGNQGDKGQSNILPNHRTAAPVQKTEVSNRPAGVTPTGVPVNDDDAGRGTGNLRGGGSNKGGVGTWKGGAD